MPPADVRAKGRVGTDCGRVSSGHGPWRQATGSRLSTIHQLTLERGMNNMLNKLRRLTWRLRTLNVTRHAKRLGSCWDFATHRATLADGALTAVSTFMTGICAAVLSAVATAGLVTALGPVLGTVAAVAAIRPVVWMIFAGVKSTVRQLGVSDADRRTVVNQLTVQTRTVRTRNGVVSAWTIPLNSCQESNCFVSKLDDIRALCDEEPDRGVAKSLWAKATNVAVEATGWYQSGLSAGAVNLPSHYDPIVHVRPVQGYGVVGADLAQVVNRCYQTLDDIEDVLQTRTTARRELLGVDDALGRKARRQLSELDKLAAALRTQAEMPSIDPVETERNEAEALAAAATELTGPQYQLHS